MRQSPSGIVVALLSAYVIRTGLILPGECSEDCRPCSSSWFSFMWLVGGYWISTRTNISTVWRNRSVREVTHTLPGFEDYVHSSIGSQTYRQTHTSSLLIRHGVRYGSLPPRRVRRLSPFTLEVTSNRNRLDNSHTYLVLCHLFLLYVRWQKLPKVFFH